MRTEEDVCLLVLYGLAATGLHSSSSTVGPMAREIRPNPETLTPNPWQLAAHDVSLYSTDVLYVQYTG